MARHILAFMPRQQPKFTKLKYFITLTCSHGGVKVKMKYMLQIYIVPSVDWYQHWRIWSSSFGGEANTNYYPSEKNNLWRTNRWTNGRTDMPITIWLPFRAIIKQFYLIFLDLTLPQRLKFLKHFNSELYFNLWLPGCPCRAYSAGEGISLRPFVLIRITFKEEVRGRRSPVKLFTLTLSGSPSSVRRCPTGENNIYYLLVLNMMGQGWQVGGGGGVYNDRLNSRAFEIHGICLEIFHSQTFWYRFYTIMTQKTFTKAYCSKLRGSYLY